MTDIEQKALALLNEVRAEREFGLITWFDREEDIDDIDREALCRAIEQHEAFRQEVSDAAVEYNEHGAQSGWLGFDRFIIAKPDPLVEAVKALQDGRSGSDPESYAACLRNELKSRGLEIRETKHD